MIRKPDGREFRESTTVAAIRDTRTLVSAGGRGLRDGVLAAYKWWFIGIFGFSLLMSVLPFVGVFGGLLIFGGAIVWYRSHRKRSNAQAPARPSRSAPARTVFPEDQAIEGSYDVSVSQVGRRAVQFAVVGFLLFPISGFLSALAPLMLFGIALFALAVLTIARLFGVRAIVRYDARTLTVRGLLSEATILWDDVEDIRIRKAAFYDLPRLFTSGSRRNIVVTAAANRLGGPVEMLIPCPLLGLDTDGMAELIGIMLSLQSHAPIAVIDALKQQRRSPPSAPSQAAQAAAAPFDPDAIMARYLADRDQVRADVRPDSVYPGMRPAFGRKGVAARS